MKILMYSKRSYDKLAFEKIKGEYDNLQIDYTEAALNEQSAIMAKDYDAVCVFVNDVVNKKVLEILGYNHVNLVLCRCAGTNNVDMEAARNYSIEVKNVPAYSPESVAEFAFALLMAVNRKTHRAYNRVQNGNFALDDLGGFCLKDKTVGVIGYGKIGKKFVQYCKGFDMNVLVYDPGLNFENSPMTKEDFESVNNIKIVDLDTLYAQSNIISLHVPLLESTYHMIDAKAIKKMKKNVILINVSRGGLIDTNALIKNITKFFGVGLDVYEGEQDNAFKNHENDILINNPVNKLHFKNVLITPHEAFLTDTALEQIARTTIENAVGPKKDEVEKPKEKEVKAKVVTHSLDGLIK